MDRSQTAPLLTDQYLKLPAVSDTNHQEERVKETLAHPDGDNKIPLRNEVKNRKWKRRTTQRLLLQAEDEDEEDLEDADI